MQIYVAENYKSRWFIWFIFNEVFGEAYISQHVVFSRGKSIYPFVGKIIPLSKFFQFHERNR